MYLKKYYIPGGKSSFVISVIAVAVIVYLHITTLPGFHIIHIIHYYMLYLVVIYVAMKFGFLGGLISAFVITIFYAPGVYLNIFDLRHYHIRGFVEVLMMYTLGLFAGLYSQKLYLQNYKLKQMRDELEESLKMLQNSTDEKIQMEKEIAKSDKLRVMGQLAAGIAHEIRNPLASLKSASIMLREGNHSPKISKIMISEIDRLNAFVERFLQYANFGKIENEPINVKTFFSELCELFSLLCKTDSDIRLVTDGFVGENCFIEGDINNLKQVFLNIFSNSVEELKNYNGEKTIYFEIECEEDYVIFRVRDTGTGIPEELQSKICDPFFTTKETGTGLGLTITNKIIKDHEGILDISNNNGAEFTIKFKRYYHEDYANRG